MNLAYTATPVAYLEDGISMLVKYEREGYSPLVVGCLLPPVGVSMDDHYARYAPWAQWEYEDEKKVGRWKPALGVPHQLTRGNSGQVIDMSVPVITLDTV